MQELELLCSYMLFHIHIPIPVLLGYWLWMIINANWVKSSPIPYPTVSTVFSFHVLCMYSPFSLFDEIHVLSGLTQISVSVIVSDSLCCAFWASQSNQKQFLGAEALRYRRILRGESLAWIMLFHVLLQSSFVVFLFLHVGFSLVQQCTLKQHSTVV